MARSARTPAEPFGFISTIRQLPFCGVHESVRLPLPTPWATQKCSAAGGTAGAPPLCTRKSERPASKRVATSRRTPAKYESTAAAGAIPTNSGLLLSVRMRTVPSRSRATNQSPAVPLR